MNLADPPLTAPREWFSTAEVARLVGRAEYSVREWCRLGRIAARKRACGRGKHRAWEIQAGEVTRYLNHGLRAVSKV